MAIKVEYAADSDAPRAFEIERAAYSAVHDPVEPLLFPGPFPEGAHEERAADVLRRKAQDPTTVWLKAVDTDTGDMIGFAEWHIYLPGEPIPSPPLREFGQGSNPEICKAFFGAIDRKRAEVMGGKAYVFLKFLHTDPNHQRRGAGSALIQWGVEKSRELKLPAYLEASTAGHKLYEKHGFHDIGTLDFDLERWGGDGNSAIALMLRPYDS